MALTCPESQDWGWAYAGNMFQLLSGLPAPGGAMPPIDILTCVLAPKISLHTAFLPYIDDIQKGFFTLPH